MRPDKELLCRAGGHSLEKVRGAGCHLGVKSPFLFLDKEMTPVGLFRFVGETCIWYMVEERWDEDAEDF
jgi:hypothetical protein